MPPFNRPWHDLSGQTFGRLTVLRLADERKGGRIAWLCQCSCGEVRTLTSHQLRQGGTRSCGCYAREACGERARRHGSFGTPEYSIWAGIIQRTCNPKAPAWDNYGGRGITMCPRWRESFANFLADMGKRPSPDHSVERIDNEQGYSPENCKWILRSEQNRNKRNTHSLTSAARRSRSTPGPSGSG